MNHHVTSLLDHVNEFEQNHDLPHYDRHALSSIVDASRDFLNSRLQRTCSRVVNHAVVSLPECTCLVNWLLTLELQTESAPVSIFPAF